MLTGFILAT